MARKRKRRNRRSGVRGLKRIVKIPIEYFGAVDLGNTIFPALYQFENGLRLLLHGFLATCYGADWWNLSLKANLPTVYEYAENQQKRLDSMPWIGSTVTVAVLPVHLVTLGHLEEIVKKYRSDCIPELFPTLEFFLGHMELIKRVRNMYTHMFPCISRRDCQIARSEIRVLALHINSKLG
jgi:hypothetical protein